MRQTFIFFMALLVSSCVFEVPPEEYVVLDHHYDNHTDDYYYEFVYIESQAPPHTHPSEPLTHLPLYCSENTLVSCCTWETYIDGDYCHEQWCVDKWYPEEGWFLMDESCY